MPSLKLISEASATFAASVASALHRHELSNTKTFSNTRESGDYYGNPDMIEMTKLTASYHYGAFRRPCRHGAAGGCGY